MRKRRSSCWNARDTSAYANCGLPYFVGGVIEDEDDLLLQTPDRLFAAVPSRRARWSRGHRDRPVEAQRHRASHRRGRARSFRYDALILSPGAAPVRPPLPGFDRVRVLRTVEDAELLAGQAQDGPRSAVVIGAGFVGLETAENLANLGIETTVVEAAAQVLTPLDPELAVLVAAEMVNHGVAVETGVSVAEVTDGGVLLADRRAIPVISSWLPSASGPTYAWPRWPGWRWDRTGALSSTTTAARAPRTSMPLETQIEKADSVGGDPRSSPWRTSQTARAAGSPTPSAA